jgi:hypothetical protein
MIGRYAWLRSHPQVFKSMTGLTVAEFDALERQVRPQYRAAEQARLSRPTRQRAIRSGHAFTLSVQDQLLLTVVWLRQYPTHEVLGYLFGVSDSTVSRTVARLLPVLEAAGMAGMRPPHPGQRSRRTLDALFADVPELVVLIDTFEQRVQRPRDRAAADTLYSGKKKQHTLKSQVAVDETSGRVVDVSESVPGPTNDLRLLADSGLLARLPPDVGAAGDLAYVGIAPLHPQGLGATPRRKPRGKPRPDEDIAYNQAFARRRVGVEHTIGRMRRYQALTQPDRHHRRCHTARVRAVAGLANLQLDHRLP